VLEYAESFLEKPEFVMKDLNQRKGVLFDNRMVDSKRDEIMRIIIAIAENDLPETKDKKPLSKFGESYRRYRQKQIGRKTHILNREETKQDHLKTEE
jgi:hypothetical protein